MPDPSKSEALAGRGGLKLQHALEAFGLNVAGLVAADFGCNVGGFTDCLLRRGARQVYSIDTGYGILAWTLRQDPRVVVMERTNALHATPPADGVDLVVLDLGWTPQAQGVPAALGWLRASPKSGSIVSLIKPHYEALGPDKAFLRRGVLAQSDAERILERVLGAMPSLGVRVQGITKSPILGRKGKGTMERGSEAQRQGGSNTAMGGGGVGRGNAEWLAWLVPTGDPPVVARR
jgi:23S rRNA (cytidine1920-2'-O)/16S rRNA (cytidine1409-2'-O)-methyltransferase